MQPRDSSARLKRPMVTCSPVETTTSYSLTFFPSPILPTMSTSLFVSPAMAETTTTMSWPRSFALATRPATLRILSMSATDVPPYFCTMSIAFDQSFRSAAMSADVNLSFRLPCHGQLPKDMIAGENPRELVGPFYHTHSVTIEKFLEPQIPELRSLPEAVKIHMIEGEPAGIDVDDDKARAPDLIPPALHPRGDPPCEEGFTGAQLSCQRNTVSRTKEPSELLPGPQCAVGGPAEEPNPPYSAERVNRRIPRGIFSRRSEAAIPASP